MDTEWGKLLVAKKDISPGLHQVVRRIRAISLLKIYTIYKLSTLLSHNPTKTTTEERMSAIEKSAEGKSYREIAEITGISKSQAAEIVKK
jgi:hypothetical protein